MSKVTVTAKTNHIDDQGIMRTTGEQYETNKAYAEQRKGSGLVEYDGESKTVEGVPLVHAGVKSDSGKTTTAIVNQPEGDEGGLVPVGKKELEARKEADKATAAKKTVKEKVEGKFPGSEIKE